MLDMAAMTQRVSTLAVTILIAVRSGHTILLGLAVTAIALVAIFYNPVINTALSRRRQRGGVQAIVTVNPDLFSQVTDHYGLADKFDLIVTCTSPHSRNRHVGEQLGLGKSLEEILAGMNMVAEGVKTAQLVGELSEKYDVAMPICHQIQGVITGKWSPLDAYTGLVPTPGHELEPEQVR